MPAFPSFPEPGHRQSQARIPLCIHGEAIPAAGKQQQGRRPLTPAATKPGASGMTYGVCGQRRPGPWPRRQRSPIPGSLQPLRPGQGAVEPTLFPRS
ncbi:unnamed protein product [Coccothraustes coccothraustes]